MSISNMKIFKQALTILTTATILTGCGGSKENQNLIGVARINETKYYRVTIDEEEYFIPITALLGAISEKGTTCYVTIGINGKGNVVVNAADSEAELKNKQIHTNNKLFMYVNDFIILFVRFFNYLFASFAIASLTPLIVCNGFPEFFNGKVWPINICEIKL